jgi:UDP-3-O-[3-hydroxymyristoyl] glucosamine N-acyltransferase
MMRLSEIAALLGGELVGDGDVLIDRVAKIEEAERRDITFVANPKYERYLETSKASAIIVSKVLNPAKTKRQDVAYIRVDDPYVSFLLVLKQFSPSVPVLPAGIHPTAIIAATAELGDQVAIGAHVVIGEKCRIGNKTTISHGTVLEDEVEVGDETLIYPNVTVRERCRIGNRVIAHPGVVIGSDGFGFAPKSDGTYEKIPQLGIVVIEDDVEIGANTTIDRATMGETLIKRGSKVDNLVQIAHNVVIGDNTVIAAQSGIAGSTKLGKNVLIGGQVGIIGHLEIADRTTVTAQSGIGKSIKEPGKTYFGSPAKEHSVAFRQEGAIRQLPELLRTIQELQKKVEILQTEVKTLADSKPSGK